MSQSNICFLSFFYYFSIYQQKVVCVADRTQIVLDDLARRHSQILDVQQGNIGGLQESMSTVITRTPLAELIGYSSTLRTLTSGQADFTLAIDGYEPV
jgi:elongation factor G